MKAFKFYLQERTEKTFKTSNFKTKVTVYQNKCKHVRRFIDKRKTFKTVSMINIKPKSIQLYPNKCKHVRHFVDKMYMTIYS